MQIEIKINGEAAELHDVLRALLNSTEPVTTTTSKSATAKAPAKAKETTAFDDPIKVEITPEPTPEVSNPSTEAISFEEFRAAVGKAALIDKDAVKATIKKYDAEKTSEVKPEDYAAIMDELKTIK